MTRAQCRAAVIARACGACERCGAAISDRLPAWHRQRLHMNHKVPLSRGGADDPSNCEALCQGCHLFDGHAPTAARGERLRKTTSKGLW
jgi:5-methylcytosine-specific restriction endonuclease McrA